MTKYFTLSCFHVNSPQYKIIGDLKQTTTQLQQGHVKTKDLMGRIIAQLMYFKLYTFLSSPLQNNNLE